MQLSTKRLICHEKLNAPTDHLGVLIEPEAASLRALSHSKTDENNGPKLLGRSVAALRDGLLARLGFERPVIMAGHQLEFFHAGVLAKNIAAATLAEAAGGSGVFLGVDSDVPKRRALVVPQKASDGSLRPVDVEIPGCDLQASFEAQPAMPREHWLQFFARVGSLHEGYGRSVLGEFAQAWIGAMGGDAGYCEGWLAAQHAAEQAIGIGPLRQVRMSALSETPEFRMFVAHLAINAEACAVAYNHAQDAYRSRHGVRTPGRPVPRLIVQDGTFELPFWVVRPNEPRRRLFVTQRGSTIEFATDNAVVAEIPRDALADPATHEGSWVGDGDWWGVRPRALALSAFARLVLSDLFLHGIGGAKYDEIMEAFIASLLGTPPPAMGCVSATMHLPLPRTGVRKGDVLAARRAARDVRYNPQRHIEGLPDHLVRTREELVRRSEELRQRDPNNHAERRTVFREIRRVSEQMLSHDAWRPAQYEAQAAALEQRLEQDVVATDREYFYGLHPRDALAVLVSRIREHILV